MHIMLEYKSLFVLLFNRDRRLEIRRLQQVSSHFGDFLDHSAIVLSYELATWSFKARRRIY